MELEDKTRKERVNPRLKAAGWQLVPYAEAVSDYGNAVAVEEFPTDDGPADYALTDAGAVLGVVEAKKVTLGPEGVLPQAERYSKGCAASSVLYGDGFRVPFLYSTNGEVIWFHDIRDPLSRSRRVSGFHTCSALEEMLARDWQSEHAVLAQIPANPYLRSYQLEANQAIETAVAKRQRRMLIAMATGTGKTVTLVNEIYRLMKSGLARRVLFLVDRRALAAQAVRTFTSFEAEPGLKFDKIYETYSQRFFREDVGEDEPFDPKVIPTGYLTNPQLGQTFVYVSTVQRMTVNLFGRDAALGGGEDSADDDAPVLDIPIHAFDLVVADECHRGYSAREVSVWRRTLDHFDAIKIGLTATPAAHTMAYFQTIAYRYEYERAVTEGYLVDYDAVRVNSGVRMHGVFLKEGEHVASVDTVTGLQAFDYLEDERQFDSSQIERDITAPDSNRRILEEVKAYALEHEEECGRFPKILIFADNDLPHTSHADQLVGQARDVFGQGDAFVAKITGKVDRPLQRIREFRNRPKPGIAVTVDMLTTGIDIPDLEFIVFLRPVQSRILFEQMLGRGTRKGERFPDKSHFVVFDCFDGTLLKYFRSATAMTADPPDADSKTVAQIIEGIWKNQDRDYNVRRLVRRLRRIDKEMSGDARVEFSRFVPDGDVGAFAEMLSSLVASKFTETMELLRDPRFQKLLVDYPRPPRTFLVALETKDHVTSEWLIRGATGELFRPEDYLKAFDQFVLDNAETIEAIAVLLARPDGWNAETLRELRMSLAAAPQRFTEANLQRAVGITRHKALADIISIVKRAAWEDSLLMTAEERVNWAVERVTSGMELTVDQAKWVDYIRQHLIGNLSIDQSDFDDIPVLSNRGGWGRANRVFDGQLDGFVAALNTELATA